MNGFVLILGEERRAHGFSLLEIRESGALPGNEISAWCASHNPNRSATFHPKTPRCLRQTGLVNLALRVVALIQNDGLICLRHNLTVPVLVQCVNIRP